MKLTHLVMLLATVAATPAVIDGQTRAARPAAAPAAKPTIQVFEGAG